MSSSRIQNITQRNDGLENLAGVTSAGAVLRLASTTSPLARIASETAAYYVATFDAEASDRPGQNQRLELKVTREGVTTRARNEVFIGRGGAPPPAPSRAPPHRRAT